MSDWNKDDHPRGGDAENPGRFSEKQNSAPEIQLGANVDPELSNLLESAADLQAKVPDLVLVGGSVAAMYANHRLSYDHDHVMVDLRDRFDVVLSALDEDPEYLINRQTPGKIILGERDGVEYGIRQLIRKRPLEANRVQLRNGSFLVAPTIEEALRIKAYLVVKRNQVRDYLDVAALADRMGIEPAAKVLGSIDEYYSDENQDPGAVATQVAQMLFDPQPRDSKTIERLSEYKGLAAPWRDWKSVKDVLRSVAAHM